MSQKGRIRRVRVIKDKAKHRRRQFKKLFRLLLKVIVYVVILVSAIMFIWMGIDMLFRPRGQD